MDYNNISIDADSLENSRGETLIEKLRDEIKQKQNIINEKNKIISSLRGQVEDLEQENEEFERNGQILKQKNDRAKKDLDEKNEELEAVSRALKEMESANEILQQRLDGRVGQLKAYIENLKQVTKSLNDTQARNEELQNQNERIGIELESLRRKHNLRQQERESDENDTRQIQELQSQINSLTRKNQSLSDQCQKQLQLIRHLQENHEREKQERDRSRLTSAIQFSVADEVGEIMDSHPVNSHIQQKRCLNISKLWDQNGLGTKKAAMECETFDVNNMPPPLRTPASNKQQFYDPIAEQKMRIERANELARRNNLTKPLLQTSYPLELDTFDMTDYTENEIKKGEISKITKNEIQHRQALSDFSNRSRKPVKKAEAFVVI